MSRIYYVRLITAACIALSSLGCGPGGAGREGLLPASGSPPPLLTAAQWPGTPPQDALQPWEQLDPGGHPTAARRQASDLDSATVFATGVERYDESPAGVSDNLSAARMESGAPGGRLLSYAIYRLPLGSDAPGAVSIDANPLATADGDTSRYFVGISDYTDRDWEWHGPFDTNHPIISTGAAAGAGTNYTSPLGNLFLCVVAFDGARIDLVKVACTPRQNTDDLPPARPAGLDVNSRQGALELEWDGMELPDLAGYRVYYSSASFSSIRAPGVDHLPYLLARCEHIHVTGTELHCRVSAVDASGNESGLSEEATASPLPGTPLHVRLGAEAPSGPPGTAITLTAAGGESYDWDPDGDGTYEIEGAASAAARADTSRIGMLRAAVRGANASGTAAGLAGVSILLEANSRPVASAQAAPQSGQAPLSVTFTGQAEDEEDPVDKLAIAWDFNGDGNFEADTDTLTPPVQVYATPGLYNVKLRVEDTKGSWDVDTVAVLVLPPDNLPPQAALSSPKPYGDVPLIVSFDASGSSDPDGTIARYDWDFDGDGVYDGYSYDPTVTHKYTDPGVYLARVRVEDDAGGAGTASLQIYASSPGVWPMFGHDAQHTHRSPHAGPATNALKWQYRFQDGGFDVFSPACIAPDGTIYASNADHSLNAINPDGSLKWECPNGGTGFAAPAIGPGGMIYSPDASHGGLRAINPDGSLEWSFETGDNIFSAPLVADDGTIYIGCDNHNIYAINPDGSLKWVYATSAEIRFTPAVWADGTLAVINYDGYLYILHPDGTLKWSHNFDMNIYGSPVIAPDGTLYIGSDDAKLYAFDPDGNEKWTCSLGTSVNTTPALMNDGTVIVCTASHTEGDPYLYAISPDGQVVWSIIQYSLTPPVIDDDGTIYVVSSHNLYAINPDGSAKWSCPVSRDALAIGPDGTLYASSGGRPYELVAVSPEGVELWRTHERTRVTTAVSIAEDGTNYFGASDNKLYALDCNGELEWTFSTNGDVYSTPAIGADLAVYFGSQDDGFYALAPDGRLKWSYTTQSGVRSSPVIGPDGTICVGGADGYLYAFNQQGELKWAYDTDRDIYSSPAIGLNRIIYVGCYSGPLFAINPDGYQVWSNRSTTPNYSSPALGTDGTIYVGDRGYDIFAINPDGTDKWSYPTGFEVQSSPAIAADGTVYISSWDGYLYAMNPDGSLKWRLQGWGSLSPSVDRAGTIYTGHNDDLSALNPDGTEKWSFTTTSHITQSPSIGADGTIYIGSADYLYAIGPGVE